jgi:hypothetical protein
MQFLIGYVCWILNIIFFPSKSITIACWKHRDILFIVRIFENKLFFLKYVAAKYKEKHYHDPLNQGDGVEQPLSSCFSKSCDKLLWPIRDRPFNLKGGVMVFCFVQKFFFRTTRELEYIFFQSSTLGYMTKTLNQIIFFSSTKIRIFFSATLGIRILF